MQYNTSATLAYTFPLAGGVDRGQRPGDGHGKPIDVTVIFTEIPGTLRALEKSAELTKDLNARIRLLVPQVVPYPLPLESPPVLVEFKERRFLALACVQSIDTHVEIYLCRDAEALLLDQLGSRSLVVIGGRRRWWPTREMRLARKLQRRGHVVVFADVSEAPRKDAHV